MDCHRKVSQQRWEGFRTAGRLQNVVGKVSGVPEGFKTSSGGFPVRRKGPKRCWETFRRSGNLPTVDLSFSGEFLLSFLPKTDFPIFRNSFLG